MDKISLANLINKKFKKVSIIALVSLIIILVFISHNAYMENYKQEEAKITSVIDYFLSDLEGKFNKIETLYNRELRGSLLNFYFGYTDSENNDYLNNYTKNLINDFKNLDDTYEVNSTNHYLITKSGYIKETDFEEKLYKDLTTSLLWKELKTLNKGEVYIAPLKHKKDNLIANGFIKLPDGKIFGLEITNKVFREEIFKGFSKFQKGNYMEFQLLVDDFNSLYDKDVKITEREKESFLSSIKEDKIIVKTKSLFDKVYYKGWSSKYGNHYIKLKVSFSVIKKIFMINALLLICVVFMLFLLKNKLVKDIKKVIKPLENISKDMKNYTETGKNTCKVKDTDIEEIDNIKNSYINMITKINDKDDKLKDSYGELEESYQEIDNLATGLEEVITLTSSIINYKLEDEKVFLSNMLRTAIDIIPEADYGGVFFYEEDKVRFVDAVGHDVKILNELNINEETLHIKENEILVIDNIKYYIKNNNKSRKELDKALLPIKQTMMFAIYVDDKKSCGLFLNTDKNRNKEFKKESIRLLRDYKNLISVFYKIQSYYSLHKKVQEDIIMAMTKMLEIHDTYTNNHSKSVAEIATKIAEHMDISKEKTKEIYWAGIVHDIGKTIIPSEIINKKGKLTDEEFEIIKKHPIWGYEALKNSEELKDIANYVRYHHERWDGNGYPDGLEGEDIPLIAQILTVADTWNAMTSDRSYRKALPKEVAKEEILKNKGSQFSPNVVDAFIDLLENVKLEYNLGRSNA